MNVVTQKIKPLTKNDLTDDLIGREVVWNSDKLIDLTIGKRYEVLDINLKDGLITIKDNVGHLREFFIARFAIPVGESEEKAQHDAGCKGKCGGTFTCSKCKRNIGYCYGGDGDELCNDCWTPKEKQPKPVTETTHSCTLEFPNGETVTVPDPEGDIMNVVTQKIKPLTKNDLTDDLIGREVVWNSTKQFCITAGKGYEVIDIDLKLELITIKDDIGYRRDLHVERFALPVEESEASRKEPNPPPPLEEKPSPPPSPPKPVTETTNSCTLEFPNGETVTIPGPEGNDWKAETERFDWPKKHYKDLWTKLQLFDVKHSNGKLILDEYTVRMHNENARIVSITKWTRDPNYQPPEREETFEERAIRRYPSRMRG